jgi:Flp pilus assembly protein TadD
MLNATTKYLRGLAAMIMGAALLVLVLLAVGCGGSSTKEKKDIIVKLPRQQPTVTPPPPVDTIRTGTPTVEVAQVTVPEPEPVTYEQAESAFTEGRYPDAVQLFTRYTERKSENPWGFYMLGLSARMTRDYETAEVAFNRALELDPKHVKSHLNLSRVLLVTDRADIALTQVDTALHLDAESVDAWRLRGRALRQLADKNGAIESYRHAIVLDGSDAWSMNNMALIYIEEGRFEEALPMLARAVEIDDGIPVFFNNLGMALEGTGHFRAAEEAYQNAVTIDRLYEHASVNLARVELVNEQVGLEPVNLAELSRQFVDSVSEWSESVEVATDSPDAGDPAPDVVINESDEEGKSQQ